MQRRSTIIVLAGLLTLLLGAATTVSALRSRATASAAPQATVDAAAAPAPGFEIPDGKRAIAVSLDPVAGAAGVARAGSRVDVYAAVSGNTGAENAGGDKAARMIMQSIEVLRVDGGGASEAGSAQNALENVRGSTVFVLAVTPTEAEKIVFHGSFSKLWFSVVDAEAPRVGTPGVTSANQLQPEGA